MANVVRVIGPRLDGDAKLGAEECTAELSTQLLHAIRIVSEALAEFPV